MTDSRLACYSVSWCVGAIRVVVVAVARREWAGAAAVPRGGIYPPIPTRRSFSQRQRACCRCRQTISSSSSDGSSIVDDSTLYPGRPSCTHTAALFSSKCKRDVYWTQNRRSPLIKQPGSGPCNPLEKKDREEGQDGRLDSNSSSARLRSVCRADALKQREDKLLVAHSELGRAFEENARQQHFFGSSSSSASRVNRFT